MCYRSLSGQVPHNERRVSDGTQRTVNPWLSSIGGSIPSRRTKQTNSKSKGLRWRNSSPSVQTANAKAFTSHTDTIHNRTWGRGNAAATATTTFAPTERVQHEHTVRTRLSDSDHYGRDGPNHRLQRTAGNRNRHSPTTLSWCGADRLRSHRHSRGATQSAAVTRTEVGTVTFLTILALLQVADAATTRMVLDAGGSESNPLMVWAAESLPRLLLVKVIGVAVIARFAWTCRTSGWPVFWLASACTFYSAVVLWNLSNLAVAT